MVGWTEKRAAQCDFSCAPLELFQAGGQGGHQVAPHNGGILQYGTYVSDVKVA